MDWFISFNDFQPIWTNQPSYLIAHCLYLTGGVCTLKHAISNGGRWPFLWFITIISGITIELTASFLPQISNFWHSQSPVMLFGKLLPLGIVFLYPCLYYISMFGASLLYLPMFHECLATGILTLLINVPVSYVGVKYLHWTWHDSDPNLSDRSYWVPWTDFMFHFFNSTSICALYRIAEIREKYGDREISSSSNWNPTIFTTLLTAPIVFNIFGILYHPLHDHMLVNTQIIFMVLFAVSASLVWRTSYSHNNEAFLKNKKLAQNYIVLYLFLHYSIFILIIIIWNPEEHKSVGFHQPIGDCDATEYIQTIYGQVLERKKYLCFQNYSQDYFDFHCVPKFQPSKHEVVHWYTICGTSFKSKAEYLCIMIGITMVAFIVFKTVFSSNSQKQKARKQT